METMSLRYRLISALLSIVLSGETFAVGLEIVRHPGRSGYQLEAEPIVLSVHLAALQVSETEYVRSNWTDYLELSITGDKAQAVSVVVKSKRMLRSTLAPRGNERRNEGIEHLWSSDAEVVLEPLPSGEYRVECKYRDISGAQIRLKIFRGDENPGTLSARLQRDSERAGLSFQEYRTLQLMRLDINPNDVGILWNLAWRAERRAPIEETDGYYASAVETERAQLYAMLSSDEEELRAQAISQRREFRLREEVASAIRTLLPEYYLNRKGRSITRSFEDGKVELIEWPSRRVIRSITVNREVLGP